MDDDSGDLQASPSSGFHPDNFPTIEWANVDPYVRDLVFEHLRVLLADERKRFAAIRADMVADRVAFRAPEEDPDPTMEAMMAGADIAAQRILDNKLFGSCYFAAALRAAITVLDRALDGVEGLSYPDGPKGEET